MVLDPGTRTLYIFAGQREDKYLSDMWTYDTTTNAVSEVWSNYTASGGPDPCFTQRAVINTKSKEIYMLVTHRLSDFRKHTCFF
jgi:muskelin